jgi:hypothetical protein
VSRSWAEGDIRERTKRMPGPWIAEVDISLCFDGI